MGSRESNEFGDWLRVRMDDPEWSRGRLARKTGISEGAIKSWIDGKRNVSERYVDLVADAFGVSRNFLRGLAHRPPTDDDPIEQADNSEPVGIRDLTREEIEFIQALRLIRRDREK